MQRTCKIVSNANMNALRDVVHVHLIRVTEKRSVLKPPKCDFGVSNCIEVSECQMEKTKNAYPE